MRLSARADYALRAAIELAAAQDGHVTAEQLAQAQNIPGKFLETILTHLRRSNIVRSQRGPDGGFWLARPASEISLADIIRAIDGQLLGVRGERPENVSYPGAAEPLQRVWIALRANERAVLETVTLADIVASKLPDAIQLLIEAPRPGSSCRRRDRSRRLQPSMIDSDADNRGQVVEAVVKLAEVVVKRLRRLGHLDRDPLDRQPVRRDAQAGLAEGSGEDRLVLQLGQGEVIGHPRNTWDSGVSRAEQIAASNSDEASLRPRSTSDR